MLFSIAKSPTILRFALFLTVATFPLAILGLEENSELLEVEKERHSLGRHRHEEGDAENGQKGLALEFPEQLTISIGGSGKIKFKYRFFRIDGMKMRKIKCSVEFWRPI
jgi:hypothetical protein